MCLAVLAIAHPRQPTRRPSKDHDDDWVWVVVANRDEVHDRPSADMQPWADDARILAGRDLQAGGSWLGVHTDGRFALLTNYREPGKQRPDAPSRGFLVEQFLRQSVAPAAYLDELESTSQQYNGFNLLLGEQRHWWHASNRAQGWKHSVYCNPTDGNPTDGDPTNVGPGETADTESDRTRGRSGHPEAAIIPAGPCVFGLSNALFDTPWPKVIRARQAVQRQLALDPHDMDSLAKAMHDTNPAPDAELPHTGLDLARERMLSSPFILSPGYGTRCTTVVILRRDGTLSAQETTYFPDGSQKSLSRWQSLDGAWQRITDAACRQ